jgi:hypothetical protein
MKLVTTNIRYLLLAATVIVAAPPTAHCLEGMLDVTHNRDWSVERGAILSTSADAKISNNPWPDLSYYARKAYGRTDGVVTKDVEAAGIGYDPAINDLWSLWFDGELSRNILYGIKAEVSAGAGAKRYLYKKGEDKLSFSFGMLYNERRPGDHVDRRWSARLKGSTEKVKAEAYYQPVIGNSEDYIVKGDVEAKITDGVSCFWNTLYRSAIGSQLTAMGLRFRFNTKQKGD